MISCNAALGGVFDAGALKQASISHYFDSDHCCGKGYNSKETLSFHNLEATLHHHKCTLVKHGYPIALILTTAVERGTIQSRHSSSTDAPKLSIILLVHQSPITLILTTAVERGTTQKRHSSSADAPKLSIILLVTIVEMGAIQKKC